MKKIILGIGFMVSSICYGQTIALQFGNTIEAKIGAASKHLKIEATGILPYFNVNKARAATLELGWSILTNPEANLKENEHQLAFTPIIGGSYYKYNTENAEFDGYSLVYGAEIGIRQYSGEFFISGKRYFSKQYSIGIGFRVFLNKLR